MKFIKLLSLCLFLVSGFSYGEQGSYILISGNLTEEQMLMLRNSGHKIIGYVDGFQKEIITEYSPKADFDGIKFIPQGYRGNEEQTEMRRFLYETMLSFKNISEDLTASDLGIAGKQVDFSDINKFAGVKMIEDSKSISEAIAEMSAHKRGINTGSLQEGFSTSTGELGFFSKYNFNRIPEIGVASDMRETVSFFNGYEINEERIEEIKAFYKKVYQAMGIDEEMGISAIWGTYKAETNNSKGTAYFHFSEPIGGGGGGGGSPFSALSETSKGLIPNNYSSWDSLSSDSSPFRYRVMERNISPSVLFVLPSRDFESKDSLSSW